jgi:hypothetical protein
MDVFQRSCGHGAIVCHDADETTGDSADNGLIAPASGRVRTSFPADRLPLALIVVVDNASVERERAAVFASVMCRRTPDWSAFGLRARDRQRWQGQGIPPDKAHWAAILRDLNRTLPFAVNANSRFANNPRLTVLEALREGRPGARICHQLAKNRGIDDRRPGRCGR